MNHSAEILAVHSVFQEVQSVFLLRFLSKGVMILSEVDDMESPILK